MSSKFGFKLGLKLNYYMHQAMYPLYLSMHSTTILF